MGKIMTTAQAKGNGPAANRAVDTATGAAVDPAVEDALASLLNDIRAHQDDFGLALADTGIDPAAFVANAINLINTEMLRTDRGTKIFECQQETVIGALLNCAQLGLRPGVFDEAYLIPRRGKAEFHANYKALRRLALEHPSVQRISAQAVRENDVFTVEEGTNNFLQLKPKLAPNSERGKVKYFYALAKMANGETLSCGGTPTTSPSSRSPTGRTARPPRGSRATVTSAWASRPSFCDFSTSCHARRSSSNCPQSMEPCVLT